MQKNRVVSHSPVQLSKLSESSSNLLKNSSIRLLPVKSHSATRISPFPSKPDEKQLFQHPKTPFPQKTLLKKLPPLKSPFPKSLKSISQFLQPSITQIEELFQFLPKISSFPHNSQSPIHLPKPDGYQNKKTLILDLDETLIHTQENPGDCHTTVKVGKNVIGVNIRPYAQDLLKFASSEFEVIIFTASKKKYADSIIDHLDPQRLYVHHRLYREHCFEFQGNFVKNIGKISNRNLKDVIVVDNCLVSFCLQTDNGVPVSTWFDDLQDVQLKVLMDYLAVLATVSDVRVLNQKFFTYRLSRVNSSCNN